MGSILMTFRMRRTRTARRIVGLGVLLASTAACSTDDLLDSVLPSDLEAERLQDPSQAQLLLNGVQADFECAHGAFVAAGGLMGDELEDAQLAAAVWSYDRRDFNAAPGGAFGTNICNAQLFGVYTPLSTARWSADNLLRNLETWTDAQVPERQEKIATAALYAGFSLAELGMIMCEGAIDVNGEPGPLMDSMDFFTEAEQRFTQAIEAATAAGEQDLRLAATAGRARVRLYLGQEAGAAEDARAIPPGFVFNATAADVSSSRRWNRVFHFVNFSRFHMVEEQSRGLLTGGVEDPRTRVEETTARAVDGRPAVVQTKYTSNGDPMPVTGYAEAQLILAEIEGGQTAIDILNGLRAAHDLPTLSADEEQNIQASIVEERRRGLWLEGQRLYDIRRFDLSLEPAPGTAFPKGGVYGNARCLPLPDVERFNNPNIG